MGTATEYLITIAATDLTLDVFERVKGGCDSIVGKLSGIGDESASMSSIVEGVFGAIAVAGGVVIGVVGAIGGAILELAERGSSIDNVEQAFDRLTSRIGVDATDAIAKLREGTGGLVDDMQLMTDLNKPLNAGWQASADDMGTVGAAARILAKSLNEDVGTALDSITNALTTGMSRGLTKNLGVMVDTKGASADLKASLNDLGEAESAGADADAKRAAIMTTLSQVVKDNGAATDTFADKIERGKTVVANFTDNLALAVAKSPALNAGLDAIGSAIDTTFGGDSQNEITTVTTIIDHMAEGAVTVAEVVVTAAKYISDAWGGLTAVFDFLAEGMFGLVGIVITGLDKIVDAAASLPGVGSKFLGLKDSMDQMANESDGWTKSYHDQTLEAIDDASKRATTLDTIVTGLEGVTASMLSATPVQDAHTGSTNVGTTADSQATEMSKKKAAAIAAYQQALAELDPFEESRIDATLDQMTVNGKLIISEQQIADMLGYKVTDIKKVEDERAADAALAQQTSDQEQAGIAQIATARETLTQARAAASHNDLQTESDAITAWQNKQLDAFKGNEDEWPEYYAVVMDTVTAKEQLIADKKAVIVSKSNESLTALNDEYRATEMQLNGTALDNQIANLQTWFDASKKKLSDANQLDTEHYDALVALAQVKYQAVIDAADPLFGAWKTSLETDFRKPLDDTFTKILDGEAPWTAAFTSPITTMFGNIKGIFAGFLSDLEQQLLNPFIKMVSGAMGGLVNQLYGLLGVSTGTPGGGSAVGGVLGGLFGGGGGAAVGAPALGGISTGGLITSGGGISVGGSGLGGSGFATSIGGAAGLGMLAGVGGVAAFIASIMLSSPSGRDMVDQFLTAEGGPDAIQALLSRVPGGAALWQKLTQDSDSVPDAIANIQAVGSALESASSASSYIAKYGQDAYNDLLAVDQLSGDSYNIGSAYLSHILADGGGGPPSAEDLASMASVLKIASMGPNGSPTQQQDYQDLLNWADANAVGSNSTGAPPALHQSPQPEAGDSGVVWAAQGIYATKATRAVFGEGGEPELGGPVGFMSSVLAQAMAKLGGSDSSGGSLTVNLMLDGQRLAQAIMPYSGKAMRFAGVPSL